MDKPRFDIVKINEEYQKDKRPHLSQASKADIAKKNVKLNWSIGVFKDEDGKNYTPQAIRDELSLLDLEGEFGYGASIGVPQFLDRSGNTIIGKSRNEINADGAAIAACPGGTGAIEKTAVEIMYMLQTDKLNNVKVIADLPSFNSYDKIFRKAFRPTFPEQIIFDSKKMNQLPQGSSNQKYIHMIQPESDNPTGRPKRSLQEIQKNINMANDYFGKEHVQTILDVAYFGWVSGIGEYKKLLKTLWENNGNISIAFSNSKNCGQYSSNRVGSLLMKNDALSGEYLQDMIGGEIRGAMVGSPSQIQKAAVLADEKTGFISSDPGFERDALVNRRDYLADIMGESIDSKYVEKVKASEGPYVNFSELDPYLENIIADGLAISPEGRLNKGSMSTEEEIKYGAREILPRYFEKISK